MAEATPLEDLPPVARFMRQNKWFMPALFAGIIILVGGGIYMSNKPQHGSWRFGVCRALMDFEFAYPRTFEFLTVAEEKTGVRMYMAEQNPFGNERIIQIDCAYKITNGKVSLAEIMIDRKALPAYKIARYNRLIPTLMALKELDTELPKPLPRSLDQLKR